MSDYGLNVWSEQGVNTMSQNSGTVKILLRCEGAGTWTVTNDLFLTQRPFVLRNPIGAVYGSDNGTYSEHYNNKYVTVTFTGNTCKVVNTQPMSSLPSGWGWIQVYVIYVGVY